MTPLPLTIADVLAAAAANPHVLRAIEHDGRLIELPHDQLLAEALSVAGALHARGLTAGDRIAIVVPEVSGFLRAFFGVAVGGFVPVPLCPPTQAGDVATFRRQTGDLLVASKAAAALVTDDVAVLLMSDDHAPVAPPACQLLTLDTLLAGPALSAPAPVADGAPALIQFTSGSTAAPKGVMLSHAGLVANLAAISGASGLDVRASDVGVSWLPLYHDMGLIGVVLAGVFSKIDVVIMSPVLFLKRPTAWLDAISRYRGTISFAPNFAYDLCLRRVKPSQIATLDLSSWRVAGCGAEPVRCDTLASFAERFAVAGFRSASFLPSYGLAEHSLAVSFARNGFNVDAVDSDKLVRESRAVPVNDDVDADPAAHVVRLVGCGHPFPGHELKIVDEQGQRLAERHVGRIVVRGPSVMTGYFEDPESTRAALNDGWLDTGDLGYVTSGELFVCGRTKDLIIRHGRKYHPPDLELAISSVHGVRASGVVVFGINRIDEADQVIAVLETRASVASQDITEHVRRRVRETAGLELDDVVLAPPGTIPRTTSGKVRRSEARARFEAGTLFGNRVPAFAVDA